MKRTFTALGALLCGALLVISTTTAKGGKPGGHGGSWPSSTAFNFTYNVGTVATNYHAYGVAGQVGTIAQPLNTEILGFWFVKDLGPVSGTGTVACPAEAAYPNTGVLLFADADDLGGDGTSVTNAYPITIVEVQSRKGGFANIQVSLPVDGDSDDPGVSLTYPVLYNGPFFSPFAWDLSDWVWNAEPVGFDTD